MTSPARLRMGAATTMSMPIRLSATSPYDCSGPCQKVRLSRHSWLSTYWLRRQGQLAGHPRRQVGAVGQAYRHLGADVGQADPAAGEGLQQGVPAGQGVLVEPGDHGPPPAGPQRPGGVQLLLGVVLPAQLDRA